MAPDFGRIHFMAQLSQLVYEVDEGKLAQGAKALGTDFVRMCQNDECQAMLLRHGDDQLVVIRGTQVAEHLSLRELWDDADPGHTDLGAGCVVRAGAWDALQRLWDDELGGLTDVEKPVVVTGHSLGGQRAVMFPFLLPTDTPVEVVAFAPPKAGCRQFYEVAYGDRAAPVVVGRKNDFALAWAPLDGVVCQPGPIVHLTSPGWFMDMVWSPLADSVPDHNVDLYVADIGALAQSKQESP